MKSKKRFITAISCIMLCTVLFFATALTGCKKGGNNGSNANKYNEERPLTMSTGNPDGVFNPYFSTSAYDSSIVGMTQISMLSSDEKGNVVCGDNEPVVVKDYKINTSTVGGKQYTDYSFIIKNGIKFSDGEPLTIKDVLFNLYLFLDPAYTGSSTIYSTDIVGLQEYRQQNPYAVDSSAFEDSFRSAAMQKITKIETFMQAFGIYNPPADEIKPSKSDFSSADIEEYKNDFATIAKEFRRELESDWNSTELVSYEDLGFTAKWQVYLYTAAGIDFFQKDSTGKYIKDKDGKLQVDPAVVKEYQQIMDDEFSDYGWSKTDENIKTWAINSAYVGYFPKAVDLNTGKYIESAFDESHIDATIEGTQANQFSLILNYSATSDTILNRFIAQAKEAALGTGDKKVPTISGITTSTTTTDFSGKSLGESHDVLNIKINDVDPKAIWNFSFTVAPMHYYSTHNYEGKDYINSFNAEKGEFGFAFTSNTFFEQVIKSKVSLPLGAGVYMASKSTGGVATSGSDFFDGSKVYYERNPYFHTVGSGLQNAKIKYLRYQVVDTEQMINALDSGDIDVGDPNATPDILKLVKQNNKLGYETVMTSGYGYVGINPRFIPDVTIRRAIIKAMNTEMTITNYYGDMASQIYRPMSKASWAYPDTATTYTTKYTDKNGNSQDISYEYDSTGVKIEELMENNGYTKNSNDIYHKQLADGRDHVCDYKFTIAGASNDHPAYAMFVQAAKILNAHGFKVSVVTSSQALSDLSTGKLTVWAAAWSSTIDPDMYQVYHKDSKATSVNNWGYPQIKANRKLYAFEYNIIMGKDGLSDKIDEGRQYTDTETRTEIYAEALDLIMELAVELPTYQRQDMTAYNKTLLDRNSMTPKDKLSPYNGLMSRIWELSYL